VVQLASLTDVHWSMSGEVVLMTLVGGLGTIFGPVVGAFVIISMQNFSPASAQWVTVVQGAIFVVCVLLFRRGIVGELVMVFAAKPQARWRQIPTPGAGRSFHRGLCLPRKQADR
jgi:branched-chain amino acid transport system permease protein